MKENEGKAKQFIAIYYDIWDRLQDPFQRSVYITLKRYANKNGQCYPSIKKLAKESCVSVTKAKEVLSQLEEMKIVKKETRFLENGGKTSNLYTLQDEQQEKKTKKIVSNSATNQSNNELNTTTKGLDKNQDSFVSQDDNNDKKPKSQVQYDLEEIKNKYNYISILQELPDQKAELDTCFELILEMMNSKKQTIRIHGEEKQYSEVIKRLEKLKSSDVIWIIKKLEAMPECVHNVRAYIVTLLYEASNQAQIETIINRKKKNSISNRSVPTGTLQFRNFTERDNHDNMEKYMTKLLKQYSQP